jgi:hypothetical protein
MEACSSGKEVKMSKKAGLALSTLLLVGLVFVLAACANAITPASTPAPAGLSRIDNVLQNAVTGHIAYNAPAAMGLDQTVDIQLLLSPSASADALKKQIVETGQVTEAELQVTPLMKAELVSDDPQAFTIQAFQDAPEQVVVTDAPTQWRWSVTSKKSGNQVVELTLYRQIQYDGQTYWRMVETYKNTIHITVSAKQLFFQFDWEWLVGIVLTAILIPALWRTIDWRQKKKVQTGSKTK